MDQGQSRFYEYIMERVNNEHRDNAAQLLTESFVLQQEGRFDASHMKTFQDKIMMYLKPEFVEEVIQIMKNFKG